MKTPKPRSFAARKSRPMFSTVLFSRTLAPTSAHVTPVSLRTSFCGSMTTSAVSLVLKSTVLLRVVGPCFGATSVGYSDDGVPRGLLLADVLAEELPHQPGDLVAVGLQGEVA